MTRLLALDVNEMLLDLGPLDSLEAVAAQIIAIDVGNASPETA